MMITQITAKEIEKSMIDLTIELEKIRTKLQEGQSNIFLSSKNIYFSIIKITNSKLSLQLKDNMIAQMNPLVERFYESGKEAQQVLQMVGDTVEKIELIGKEVKASSTGKNLDYEKLYENYKQLEDNLQSIKDKSLEIKTSQLNLQKEIGVITKKMKNIIY